MIEFEVPFMSGQGRPRLARATGRLYKSGTDRRHEAQVADAYTGAGGRLTGGPLAVTIDCWRPLPKSAPRGVGSEPDTHRPDVDNVCKLVLDGLNGVAWADDSQVVILRAAKHPRRPGQPERTLVRVMTPAEWLGRQWRDLEDFYD